MKKNKHEIYFLSLISLLSFFLEDNNLFKNPYLQAINQEKKTDVRITLET